MFNNPEQAATLVESEQSSTERLSAAEQGIIDRTLFDIAIKNMISDKNQATELSGSLEFSKDDAENFIKIVSSNAESHYSWINQVDPNLILRLMNLVNDLRVSYSEQYNQTPDDLYFYRNLRMKELEDPDDEFVRESVVIVDALMNGKIAGKTFVLSNALHP